MFARAPLHAGPWLLAGVLAASYGCATTSDYVLLGTPKAPSADGSAELDDVDGRTLVSIEMQHLPPPSRIADGLKHYVVWFEGAAGRPQNMGTLEYDEQTRSGVLVATTDLAAFELTITAESDGDARAPGPALVVQRKVALE